MKKLVNLYDKFTFEGISYKLTWIPSDSYDGLKPITQAYGFCFNKNNQLLVIHTDRFDNSQVPGGTVEPGETPEETLIRELDEEANIDVNDIHYLGAQKVEFENGNYVYQLRFAARITALKPRKPDPCNGEIKARKFIDPQNFAEVSGWGEIGEAITQRAIEKLDIKL